MMASRAVRRIGAGVLSVVVVALLLGGCGPGHDVSPGASITAADPAWMTRSPPLPDIPVCGWHTTERDRVACRAAYDRAERVGHVTAIQHKHALQDYVCATLPHANRDAPACQRAPASTTTVAAR